MASSVIKKADTARHGVVRHEPPSFDAEPPPDRLPAAQAVAADAPEPPPHKPSRVLRRISLSADPYLVVAPRPLPDDLTPPAPDAPPPEEPPDSADREPDPPLDPDALKAEWDAAWQERLDAAVEEARAAGHAAGYAQAEEDLRADLDEQREALAQDAARLKTLWTDHVEATKQPLADLALDLAETIVDAPLPARVKGVSTRAITTAIEDLASDPPLTVRLHPVDHMRLQEAGVTDQLDAVHDALRWDPDPDLNEGDWSVDAASGLIRRLRTEIVQTLRRRLREAASARPATNADASPSPA